MPCVSLVLTLWRVLPAAPRRLVMRPPEMSPGLPPDRGFSFVVFLRNFPYPSRISRSAALLVIQGPMTTGELARSIYPRPTQHWQRRQVRQSASKFCERIRRVRSRGHPVLSVVMRSWCRFLGAGGDHRFSRSGSLAMLAATRRASTTATRWPMSISRMSRGDALLRIC